MEKIRPGEATATEQGRALTRWFSMVISHIRGSRTDCNHVGGTILASADMFEKDEELLEASIALSTTNTTHKPEHFQGKIALTLTRQRRVRNLLDVQV